MGEFLEYVRQLHYKLSGQNPNKQFVKRVRSQDNLTVGSASGEESDKEEDVKESIKKLTAVDRSRLKRYISELRAVQTLHNKKHICPEDPKIKKKKNKKLPHNPCDNDRRTIEMEVFGIKAPLPVQTEAVSAHQFSSRSASQQADSEERNEVFLETALIDLKQQNRKIDVYDTDKKGPKIRENKLGFT